MSDPKTLDAAFEEVSKELLEMFLKKHKDYGKGNVLSMGELGVAMRIGEKVERIKHLLMKGGDPANESIDETWIDIAVFGVIGVLVNRGQFEALEVSTESMDKV